MSKREFRMNQCSVNQLRKILFVVYMCAMCAHQADAFFDTLLLRGSFVLLLGLEGLCVLRERRFPVLHKMPVLLWYTGVVAYTLLSCFWAPNLTDALNKPYLFSFAQILCLFFVLERNITSLEDALSYVKLLLVAVMYMAFRVIIHTPLNELASARLGYSIGLNPNDVSMKCAVGLILSLAFSGKNKWYYATTVILAGLIVLTESKKGILMVAMGVMILLAFYDRKRIKQNIGIAFTVLAIAIVLIMMVDSLYQKIGIRFVYAIKGLLGLGGDISTNERLFFTDHAMKMFAQKPVFGWGANSFVSEMRRIEYSHVVYSHNNYTELLATLGIVGLVLYYWFPFMVSAKTVCALIRKHDSTLLLITAVLLPELLNEFFYVSFYSIFTQIFNFLMYALMKYSCNDEIEYKREDSLKKGEADMGILKFVKKPWKLFSALASRGFFNWLPDEIYLKCFYRGVMDKELNLEKPETFNEKLQWLKLHDRNPAYVPMVDKHEVKQLVGEKIGEQYLIPTLGVWDRFEDIDFDALPNQFVLKCTHDSGGIAICRNKQEFDKEKTKSVINRSLKRNYYYYGREWPYKNIRPRIIAEQYIEDSNGQLKDYKFFCYNGKIDSVMVVADRSVGKAKFYHFSPEWRIQRYNRLCRTLPDNYTIPKPENLDEMLRLAALLSCGVPHVRIDLYNVDGEIYFGEYTLYNQSGFESGFDYPSDKHMGDLIDVNMAYKNIT